MRCSEKSIPKIGFPGFKDRWKKQKLEKLLSISSERNDGTYNCDDVLAAALGTELQKKQIFFGLKATDESVNNYKVVSPGDIVYTKSPIKGFPNGIIRASKGVRGIVPTLYCVYHCKDESDANIIQAYFEDKTRLEEYLQPLVNVGARNNVNITDDGFLEGYICLPADSKEQEEIIEFLSSVDEVIAASEQEVANLETQKKAVMKKIFSQEVRFKREDETVFPEWEEKNIDDLGEIIGGGTPKTSVEEYWNGDTPWISSADLEENNIHVVNITRYITKDAIDNSATKRVPKDAILIISRVGVGKVAVSPCELCTSQDYMSVVPCTGNIVFLGYAISKLMQDKSANVQGTSIKGIPSDEIKAYSIGIPCLEEQRLIADFLSNFDEAIAEAKKELELWKELKKGLLQQMFV